MALKSEQARVLRRRVLGGAVRNLVIFTVIFALGCVAAERTVVPTVANYVADSTSVWRTLDSSSDYLALLTEQGMFDSPAFNDQVDALAADGYSSAEGTLDEVEDELADGSKLIQAYAVDPEAAKKLKADDKLETAGIEDVNVSAAVDEPSDASEDEDVSSAASSAGMPADQEDTVPYLSYESILAAFGIKPSSASAAQAMAALHISAMIQELHLSIVREPPFMPLQVTEDQANQILSFAALYGYDETSLMGTLADAYTASQEQAYETWQALSPAEQARALGIPSDQPVWQIEHDDQGSYAMRDIATYTLLKSLKLPLAFLVFAIGMLLIVFRSLNRSLRSFDDLSGAVATLLADKDAPIDLPADLSIARNELTVIRQQSLADERAAHAAEQRKNELVAYLAHDIRTPLTSVLGYLDLLRETTDLPRDTLRHYADIAYSKAEGLEGLINEFFEITRYNLSAIPIEREMIGVRLFCQQVAEAFFPEASARNIRISVDVGPSEQFFVDPDKLARALGTVLRNAVAYADSNSVIALTARQDARFTTITVANRGREISEAHLESIFEKFYREDGARTTRSGGAGLGLAIAKEIVVAHHGDIEAASQRGVTVFTLRIPTRGEEATAPVQPLAAPRDNANAPLPPDRRATAAQPLDGLRDNAGTTPPPGRRATAATPMPSGRGSARSSRTRTATLGDTSGRAASPSGTTAPPAPSARTASSAGIADGQTAPRLSGDRAASERPTAPARLNPRYAGHGRRTDATPMRHNGATKRTQPSRRHR